ncbi:hypothetical protein [Catelliglobosispora koreensis]|nr:hypothetical protein [Catelliglobosispora koreensis]
MRARYVVGGLAIVIAVAVWAVDMAAFQPEVERLTIAENNS